MNPTTTQITTNHGTKLQLTPHQNQNRRVHTTAPAYRGQHGQIIGRATNLIRKTNAVIRLNNGYIIVVSDNQLQLQPQTKDTA